MKEVNEKDWKYIKSIMPILLNKNSENIINKIKNEINDNSKDYFKKYCIINEILDKENKIFSYCFDDWKRSNIFIKVITLIKNNLLTEEHLRNFTIDNLLL